MQSLTYLLLDAGTIAGPLALSFDRRVHFARSFGAVFRATLVVAIPFLVWDLLFTRWGVWGFNPTYLLGPSVFGLPIEEALFFVVVPFAELFIFECVRAYLPPSAARETVLDRSILGIVAAVLLVVAIVSLDRRYTLVTSLAASVMTALYLRFRRERSARLFLVSYLLHLFPFAAVNGVLTSLPVVWYDDAQNLGLRAGTIPIEDFVYSWALFIGNLLCFERFSSKTRDARP